MMIFAINSLFSGQLPEGSPVRPVEAIGLDRIADGEVRRGRQQQANYNAAQPEGLEYMYGGLPHRYKPFM